MSARAATGAARSGSARVAVRPAPDDRAAPGVAVDLWRVDLRELICTSAPLAALLDPEERARAERLRREIDRRRATASLGLRRLVLGSRLGVRPETLHFTYGESGKPHLLGFAHISFSVSHSSNLIVIAVADGVRLGVDVERVRALDTERIARRFFAPDEANALAALPESDRPAAFFACWTRKEAIVKATGYGLAELHRFAVSIAPGEPARLLRADDPELVRGPPATLDFGAGYAGALFVGAELPTLRWNRVSGK